MTEVTRRHFTAAASASLAPYSCTGPAVGEPARVSIVRHPRYDQGLYHKVSRLLEGHQTNIKGKRVVLKPNLVEFDSGASINTSPLFVHAVFEAFQSLGAASVRIAEGPGHRRITMDLAEEAGYFRLFPKFDELFTDLNLDNTTEVNLIQPSSSLRKLHLPDTVLGADLLVSLPKMKTHHWVGATLSMKNLFGLVPGGVYGWPKNVLHWAGINECIADLYRLFPHTFAIVDGIEGMEGNGPIQGVSKRAGVMIAGSNMVAVDATCCRVMGIDPERIGYLSLADRSRIPEVRIKQIGEPVHSVRDDFKLLPVFESAVRLSRPR